MKVFLIHLRVYSIINIFQIYVSRSCDPVINGLHKLYQITYFVEIFIKTHINNSFPKLYGSYLKIFNSKPNSNLSYLPLTDLKRMIYVIKKNDNSEKEEKYYKSI